MKKHWDKIGRKHIRKPPLPYKSEGAHGQMVKVHLNVEEPTVYKCDIQWYLDRGYKFGRSLMNKKPLALSDAAKIASSGKGKKIVHNVVLNLVRRIDPEELSSYLAQGWKPGYLHKNLTMRLRIRTGHPDKPHKLIEKSRSSTLPSATIFKDSSTAMPIA